MDCVAQLKTFGIPEQVLPPLELRETTKTAASYIGDNTGVREEDGYEETRRNETAVESSNENLIPSRNDVLLGRGKGSHMHEGNVWFRRLVKERQKLYDTASTPEKTRIADEIVRMVKESRGGLFLKKKGTAWVEVSDSVARLKVSHAFRALREAALGRKGRNSVEAKSTKRRNSSSS